MFPSSIFTVIFSFIKASPPAFYFGEISSNTQTTREVIVSSTQEHTLNRISVKSASKCVSFDVKPVDNGLKYKITAILAPQNTPRMIKENITVYIDDGNNHVIEIPLFALVVKTN